MDKPKCFGNFISDGCRNDHWNCEFQWKCIEHQNIHLGECNCKYKVCCHLGRQHIRQLFPDMEPNIEDCWFYKRFEATLTPEQKLKYPWKEED